MARAPDRPAGPRIAFTAVQSARDEERDDRRAKTDRQLADRRADAERSLADDRQREETLRTYVGQMSDLLLDQHIASSRSDATQRVLASTLTLTVLRRLDGERKGIVLRFLVDARLITGRDPKLVLRGADFRDANIDGANLDRPNLGMFDLRGASFRSALLRFANFESADLRGADLSYTIQDSPRFVSTCLTGATFTYATLNSPRFDLSIGHDIDFREAHVNDVRGGPPNFWRLRGSAAGVPAETTDRRQQLKPPEEDSRCTRQRKPGSVG